MEQGERKGGGREGESWRQRVVRRFVTALTRIRAALAAILGRFRIGEVRESVECLPENLLYLLLLHWTGLNCTVYFTL